MGERKSGNEINPPPAVGASGLPARGLHTPLPWVAAGWSSNGTPILGGGDGFIVAQVFTPDYGFGKRVATAEQAVAEAKATTKLIVRACNSHERNEKLIGELVGALRSALPALGDCAAREIRANRDLGPVGDSQLKIYNAAEAALKAAALRSIPACKGWDVSVRTLAETYAPLFKAGDEVSICGDLPAKQGVVKRIYRDCDDPDCKGFGRPTYEVRIILKSGSVYVFEYCESVLQRRNAE